MQRLGAERTACANILQRKSRALNLFKVQGKPPLGFGRRMTYLCLRSHLWPLAEWSPPPRPCPQQGRLLGGLPSGALCWGDWPTGWEKGWGESAPPPGSLLPTWGSPSVWRVGDDGSHLAGDPPQAITQLRPQAAHSLLASANPSIHFCFLFENVEVV